MATQTVTNHTLPALHITNYQQHIDPSYLYNAIIDSLPDDVHWPVNINVSIAYMQVQRQHGIFNTTLALSILGKAYKIKIAHDNKGYYDAQYALDSGAGNRDAKDNYTRLYQQAFQDVVVAKKKQIIKAITCAYGNK